jgi:hypothetical protein
MALGSTQPLTEMSNRNISGGKKRQASRAATLPPSASRMCENVGASTSRNHKGLHGLYRDNVIFTLRFVYHRHRPHAELAGRAGTLQIHIREALRSNLSCNT